MHNNNIKLSIIIVSYNEAEYLSECFESILKQNMDFDYEVIVGDDGSSDNSLEIIKSYESKFKYFSYFVQERQPGLASKDVIACIRASNVVFRAMEMVKGKYTNLVSGDDYFIDMNYFQRAVDFLDKNKSHSAYLTTFYCAYPDGKMEANDLRAFDRFSFWHLQYIHISCFVFRRLPKNVLLKMFCDDCGLQYSIALNGKLKYVDESAFAYRQRETSIMHSDSRECLDIVEMLLFQDVLNKRSPSISKLYAYLCLYVIAFRHFRGPFLSLCKKAGSLNSEKYKKFSTLSSQYKNDVVSALLWPNERKSKRLLKKINRWIKISDFILDRLLKSYYVCLEPCDEREVGALTLYAKKDDKIYCNIDSFERGLRSAFIQGWAFVPNVSSKIYIKANGKVYRLPLCSRTDVKDAYGLSSQNVGFLFKIRERIDSFELFLTDEKNKFVYSVFFDEKFLSKYKMSEEASGLDDSVLIERDFSYYIDACRYKHRKTLILGWAYDGDDECQVFIKAAGKIYSTRTVRRPDVMKAFSLNDDMHGFSAILPIKTRSFSIYLMNCSKHEIYKKDIEA